MSEHASGLFVGGPIAGTRMAVRPGMKGIAMPFRDGRPSATYLLRWISLGTACATFWVLEGMTDDEVLKEIFSTDRMENDR